MQCLNDVAQYVTIDVSWEILLADNIGFEYELIFQRSAWVSFGRNAKVAPDDRLRACVARKFIDQLARFIFGMAPASKGKKNVRASLDVWAIHLLGFWSTSPNSQTRTITGAEPAQWGKMPRKTRMVGWPTATKSPLATAYRRSPSWHCWITHLRCLSISSLHFHAPTALTCLTRCQSWSITINYISSVLFYLVTMKLI